MVSNERLPEHEINAQLEVGLRTHYLEGTRRLERELGFSTSNFTVVPQVLFEELGIDSSNEALRSNIELVDQSDGLGIRSVHNGLAQQYAEQLAPHVGALRAWTEMLQGDPVIVRPSPIDEVGRPGLSFAGAYKGYMPFTPMTRDEHLIWGTAAMLAGRFTKYGNNYYGRHDIAGNRAVGAIYMEPFFALGKEAPLVHGTAYISGGHSRNEYVIAPSPDAPQRDARLAVKKGGHTWLEGDNQSVENAINFHQRIDKVLDGLQSHFDKPLDVEYIVDTNGQLFILQLRQISDRHLANWSQMPGIDEGSRPHRSAIINTVGSVEGRVIDLRASVEGVNAGDLPGNIIVINHEPVRAGMHSQALFQLAHKHNLQGMSVVVDHGKSRLRDHLQYALAEDPGIDFIVQTTDETITDQLKNGEYVQIESNGIVAELRK